MSRSPKPWGRAEAWGGECFLVELDETIDDGLRVVLDCGESGQRPLVTLRFDPVVYYAVASGPFRRGLERKAREALGGGPGGCAFVDMGVSRLAHEIAWKGSCGVLSARRLFHLRVLCSDAVVDLLGHWEPAVSVEARIDRLPASSGAGATGCPPGAACFGGGGACRGECSLVRFLGAGAPVFALRYAGRGREDCLVTDAGGERVLAFPDEAAARRWAQGAGAPAARPVVDVPLDPLPSGVPADRLGCSAAGAFWDACSDVSATLGRPFLGDADRPDVNGLYSRLFFRANPPAPGGGQGLALEWDADEAALMREVVADGRALLRDALGLDGEAAR